MRKQMIAGAVVLVLSACGLLTAQSPQPGRENYQWSGELVSFDHSGKTVSVKSRVVDQEAAADVKRFKAGDRVLLMWSGHDTYADAIRRITPYGAGPKAGERFLLPVELVSPDTPNQYLTFRVSVPDGSVEALNGVKPGEWVTVTSSHRVSRSSEAIVSIRPYTAASAGNSD